MSIILFRADLESQSESGSQLQLEPLNLLLSSCRAQRGDIYIKLDKLKSSIDYQVCICFTYVYLYRPLFRLKKGNSLNGLKLWKVCFTILKSHYEISTCEIQKV